jgi:monoamine oxidase
MRVARPSRRDLLSLIGVMAGSAAAYQAMTSLGLAASSPYRGPIRLEGDPKGATVLVLGAGLAGMTAAFELRRAGYKVQVLEYNDRPGGRNWTIRGGDRLTELGGATQVCRFDEGLYFDPGPSRIPSHHRALLDYCRQFGVALEPFVDLNYNAYLHSPQAFGGKPQRIRQVKADFEGHIAELLAKVTAQSRLDAALTPEDLEILLDALKSWGALDRNYRYKAGNTSARMRGFLKNPGGGLSGLPTPGEPIALKDILESRLWEAFAHFSFYELQSTLMQPVGGMDKIGQAFGRRLAEVIRYNAKVTRIRQSPQGVTVTYEDTAHPGQVTTATADWCVCTIPLSILSQIPVDVGAKMKSAINAVPYASSVKVGLQFKRRFWEEDDDIFGGNTFTDLPIETIAYPSMGFNGSKGMLLGAYMWDSASSQAFTAMPPEERIQRAVDYGAMIHPQYKAEFENGVAAAWSRVPFTLGCSGSWTEESRALHYDDLCQIDGRIVLAGEHASYLPSWQEGAILSALDAIGRLHKRVAA